MNGKIRNYIYKRDKYRCRFCGNTTAQLTVDHVIPTSRGGHPTKRANLVSACFPCNQEKANQTPEEAGMPIITEGYDYTPPGKLNDGVEDTNDLILVNHGNGKKKRKKRERRRRKRIVKYWMIHGTLPEDLTSFD
jgi:hypothetical protein